MQLALNGIPQKRNLKYWDQVEYLQHTFPFLFGEDMCGKIGRYVGQNLALNKEIVRFDNSTICLLEIGSLKLLEDAGT